MTHIVPTIFFKVKFDSHTRKIIQVRTHLYYCTCGFLLHCLSKHTDTTLQNHLETPETPDSAGMISGFFTESMASPSPRN